MVKLARVVGGAGPWICAIVVAILFAVPAGAQPVTLRGFTIKATGRISEHRTLGALDLVGFKINI